jgi:hypothetical protein
LLLFLLFIYSHVRTLFGSFLHPAWTLRLELWISYTCWARSVGKWI